MGGSGGGGSPQNTTSTTSTSPWGPSTGVGQFYLSELLSTMFPGMHLPGQLGTRPPGLSGPMSQFQLPQMPSSMDQRVAPFNAQQNQALQEFSQITPGAMNLTGLGAGTLANFAEGKNLSPQSNPMLQAYYNAAALPMTQQYQNATMPGIMANAAQTGSVGGTGYQSGITQAQQGLGQGLSNLAAGIYEPAYQQGQQLQYGAAQALPGAAMSMYSPLSALYGAGTTKQQQSQNVLNANQQNAISAYQFPYQMLQMLGSAFGATSGAGGSTTSTTPIVGGGMPGGKL